MASNSHVPDSNLATYPAITRHAAAVVDGIPTEVTSMLFADKIMVTIAQEGRLAQWVKALLYSLVALKGILTGYSCTYRWILITRLLRITHCLLSQMKMAFFPGHILPPRLFLEDRRRNATHLASFMPHELPVS